MLNGWRLFVPDICCRELKRRQNQREKAAKKAEKEAAAPPATSSAPKQAADAGEEQLDPSVSHRSK